MAATTTPPSMDQVLDALAIFYNATESSNEARKQVGSWLETFQKMPCAWTISDAIIRRQDVPIEARIFAAQTFRQKIEYDLDQLDVQSVNSLRESILALLFEYRKGSKSIQTQLCLSVADLAIQMLSWADPIEQIVLTFGKDPDCVPLLFEFLAILPEELNFNHRINMENGDKNTRREHLLDQKAVPVMTLLFEYLNGSGGNAEIYRKVLVCLDSWMRAGVINIDLIQSAHVLDMAFQALQSEELFDYAVDVLCEVILKASKKPRCMPVIESVYKRLPELAAILQQNPDDPDIVRGMCRIFVEAAEGCVDLIAGNLASFQGLIDGLLICLANEDLDIVKITFNFWFLLAEELLSVDYIQFKPIYKQIVTLIIKHLQYPTDLESWTAKERDEFREFRHVMGDVLKDCVRILGEAQALSIPSAMFEAITDPKSGQNIAWQTIEAPLFSLRAMGREVSTSESQFMPHLMSMLPKLPPHPKINYSAILVIGRYAEWTNEHPEMLSYQLDFVSKGFNENPETMAAAAQTFRDLCKYCSKHLINYLPQLQPFYCATVYNAKTTKEERRQMSEAVAHIISVVPLGDLASALERFCLPVAQRLQQQISCQPSSEDDSIQQAQDINETISELATFLRYVRPDIPHQQGHPSVGLLTQVWPLLDQLLSLHGHNERVAEAVSRLLRNSLDACGFHIVPLLAVIFAKMNSMFEQTKFSCFVWVIGHAVHLFASEDKEEGRLLYNAVESMTALVFTLVQAPPIPDLDEVLTEYHYMISELVDTCPTVFLGSPLLTSTIDCALYCLTTPSPLALNAVLRFFPDMIKIAVPSSSMIPPGVSAPLSALLASRLPMMISAFLKGLVFTFPKDREVVASVADCFYHLCDALSVDAVIQNVKAVVAEFPDNELSIEQKEAFMNKFASAIDSMEIIRVSSVLREFAASYSRRNLINARK